MSTKKREYTAVYKKSGQWIAAWVEEIPGVNTQGRTMREARENLREALSLVIEENQRLSEKEHGNVRREPLAISVHETYQTHQTS